MHLREGEICRHALARPRADRSPLCCGERERLSNAIGECGHVARRHQPTGEPGFILLRRDDRLRQRAEVWHDNGTAHGLCLDAGAPEGLRHRRGCHRDMRCEIGARHLTTMTNERHLATKTTALDKTGELVAIGIARSVSGEDEDRIVERALGIEFALRRRSGRAAP